MYQPMQWLLSNRAVVTYFHFISHTLADYNK